MPYKDPQKRQEYARKYKEQHRERLQEKNKKYQQKYRLKHSCKLMIDEKLTKRGLGHLIGLSTDELKKAFADRARGRRSVNRRRSAKIAKAWLWDYKTSHPCDHCGESDPCCLDFHHRDPSNKRDHMARLTKNGLKAVQAEVIKCRSLCANCHRKLHFRGTLDPLRIPIRQKGPDGVPKEPVS